MNLCVDFGNSQIKLGFFERENLIKTLVVDNNDWQELERILTEFSFNQAAICSVREKDLPVRRLLEQKVKSVINITYQTKVPVKNLYDTPETLGMDRLAAVIGAYALSPKKNILIIDAGTAITFDLLNASGEYLGGSISPGLQMRIQALHQLTEKLPLIKSDGRYGFPAVNTEEALRTGIIQGIIYEIDSYINELKMQYPELLIFLTGGDCFFFESKLKNSIFANQNLVLIGLNHIINYNVKS
jgi:type III pantothenate kinase